MSAIPSSLVSLRREQALLGLCVLLLSVALLLSSQLLLVALNLGIYLALYLRMRGEGWALTRRILALGGFLVLSLLPVAFGAGGTGQRLLLDFGGWGVTEAGSFTALQALLRCYAALGAMMLLLRLVPLYRLYAVLRSLGVPKLFIELVELTYRYIFLLEETAAQIRLAQTSRLGYLGGLKLKFQHFALLLSRTFILSQTESDRLYLGLVSRGYEDEGAVSPTTPTAGAPVLLVESLCFGYTAEQETLKALSFGIDAGERIALLGHNGAGKSSLFLLLAGLQEHWQGTLYLHGQAVSPKERVQLRTHVALVLQNSNYQLFTPSVEEEISFGLKNLGLQGEELQMRLEEILATYDLTDLRHTPPHQLSEGQKKWVALAAILATDPEVLLLDEPTAALDQRYTRRIMQLLEGLHRAGKTIILSTHDMELASTFADRILLLESGELRADRPAADFWPDATLLTSAELTPPRGWRGRPVPCPTSASLRRYHLPLFLSADLLPVLFIGGGRGIWRKAQGLLERGLPFTIIADRLCPELEQAHQDGCFRWIPRQYTLEETIDAYRIIVCGIGDAQLEKRFAERWCSAGYLYALLSDPEAGNIQFGATSHQHGITLSVHSDYRLPEVAVALRDHWCGELAPATEELLSELAQLRQAYLSASTATEKEHLRQVYEQKKELILQAMIL